ncbi:membrane protein insertion efficiency factor YidD [Chlamydia sp.]|uniref:membrane protein insertion efficiency factor YidD n=1 Tax=Chlamydia sp. TaxID=35827 RepID=UPI0025BAAB2D|nr:membrane protein insertion efficiency factor YidD [Chlamydia sp.]MBQ8498628.1 membrane protein insertion efficiency factor YidD [Chlamydia sp.]
MNTSWIKTFFRGLIHLYRWTISPLLGMPCRFFPSCSEYALIALKKLPLKTSLLLIIKRLLKCGPWHIGGIDLVPETSLEEYLESPNTFPKLPDDTNSPL